MSEKTKQKQTIIKGYKPMMDWWVAGIVLIVLAILFVMLVITIFSSGTFFSKLIIEIVVFLMFIYVVDVAFFTSYFLDEEGLVINNQLRRMVFPYRKILKMEKGGAAGLWSFGSKKRFALSRKSVYVYLNGAHWNRVSLSPVQRDDFMDNLLKNIEIERSSRATIVRKH